MKKADTFKVIKLFFLLVFALINDKNLPFCSFFRVHPAVYIRKLKIGANVLRQERVKNKSGVLNVHERKSVPFRERERAK